MTRQRFGSVGLCITILMLTFVCAAQAADKCPDGLGTLNGSYLHTFDGFGYHIEKTSVTSASAAFVAAGRTTFDGAGNLEATDTASLGGLIFDRAVTGVYTLDKATCLGTVTVGAGSPTAQIVAAPNGSEMY